MASKRDLFRSGLACSIAGSFLRHFDSILLANYHNHHTEVKQTTRRWLQMKLSLSTRGKLRNGRLKQSKRTPLTPSWQTRDSGNPRGREHVFLLVLEFYKCLSGVNYLLLDQKSAHSYRLCNELWSIPRILF